MPHMSFKKITGKYSRKLPLVIWITVPFLLQIFSVVGIVGYISFRNGQKAVDELANKLIREISYRVEKNLTDYLNIPHDINQANLDLINIELLDLQNMVAWERYLWKQIQSYPDIFFIAIKNKNKEYRAAERFSDGSIHINRGGKLTNFNFESYKTNQEGKVQKLVKTVKKYNISNHTILADAEKAGKATWSSIYFSLNDPTLIISAIQPIYKKNKYQQQENKGVLITSLRLDYIGKFLNILKIGKTGQAFIIDKSTGNLIATSTDEKPFSVKNNQVKKIKAIDSKHNITNKLARNLSVKFQKFDNIRDPKKTDLRIDNKRYLSLTKTFEDARDISWLIVVVVPEDDFTEHIYANTQGTIIACIIALIIATTICIITASWIAHPILSLNKAARKLSEGKWDNFLHISRFDEIGQLAISFGLMSRELSISSVKQEKMKQELQRLNSGYSKFVPINFLKFLQKKSITEIQLGNHVSKEMAIMFSDIRSFTSLSENMNPQENFDFINAYLKRVSPKIRDNNGFIVKYLGDGIMAIFPNSIDDAIEAGLAKIKAVDEYNASRETKGYQKINLGIGIHYGSMMVGIVGETARMQGDAFSEDVEFASELESLTKLYDTSLIISDRAIAQIEYPEKYEIYFLDNITFKGKQKPMAIYKIRT
jgi:class 3 adenylate cyclase/HAMP domain-containing protein